MTNKDKVLQAVKAQYVKGETCNYTSICRETGIDFYDVREAVEALSRVRRLDIEHDQIKGLKIVAR
jgi:hypothetical protein